MTAAKFGRSDLVDAWLAWQTSAAGTDAERFWRTRTQALAAALGVDVDALGPEEAADALPPHLWALRSLAVETVRAWRHVESPFAGYLEAPPEVIALSQRHGADISGRVEALREALQALLDSALAVLWGLSDDRRANHDEVLRHGADMSEEPPSADDWDDFY